MRVLGSSPSGGHVVEKSALKGWKHESCRWAGTYWNTTSGLAEPGEVKQNLPPCTEKQNLTIGKNMYYATFGVQYAYEEHPSSSFVDPNGVIEVEAESLDDAIEIVREHFGLKYSSVYETPDSDTIFKYYPRGIIGIASKGNMTWLDRS